MGYYTRYELSVSDENYSLIEDFRNECDSAQYAFDESGEVNDEIKWYDHEDDMREFSCKHPKVLFILKGEGEENGDLWVKYFLCGKMQTCKAVISYPDFNESLLT